MCSVSGFELFFSALLIMSLCVLFHPTGPDFCCNWLRVILIPPAGMAAADVGELVAVAQPAEGGAEAQAGVGSASSLTISGAQPGLVASGAHCAPHCAIAKIICKPRANGNSVKDNAQEHGI